MRFVSISLATASAICGLAVSAQAQSLDGDADGFASSHSALVAAPRAEVWRELVHPENWWAHTWSDNSANLHLDARAGGCFCETIPASDGWPAGSVEHMRVVMVMPGRVLRMAGSLGPLQSEGLAGALTITLSDEGEGTRISWDYVTGGHSRIDLETIAPVVDTVQREFLGDLVDRLGGAVEMSAAGG